jgi:flagellar biosynthetic protein FlhB
MPMAAGSEQERTEKATPKRRQEARKKGQVARSIEIPSVLILMTTLGFFYFAGSWMFWNLSEFFSGVYQKIDTIRFDATSDVTAFWMDIFKKMFSVLTPFFVPIVIAGLVGNVFQVGFEIHVEPLKPNFSKLNPVSGLKKLISLRSLVELVKSIGKLLFIGAVAYLLIKSEMRQFPALIHRGVGEILLFIVQVAFKICVFVCLAFILLALLDYVYQRWHHEKSLKMTKQEVKDERKQTEGDPRIKSRIRRMQLQMAARRMMEAVPDADVVITNPTHLAIALKFDAEKMIAPTVLAKGAGLIAERIKEIARDHSIPIVEDKPLTQALHKMVEIGEYIPVELYRAVAEVLAYVYRLKGKFQAT